MRTTENTSTARASRPPVPAAARAGGALMVVVGLANLVFGTLGLLTDVVRLSPTTSGALLMLGLLTTSLAVLVLRGSSWALTVSVTIFTSLLVLQLPSLLDGGGQPGVIGRATLLGLLVVLLGFGKRTELAAR